MSSGFWGSSSIQLPLNDDFFTHFLDCCILLTLQSFYWQKSSSLQTLASFVSSKMRSMASMISISDEYIESVSTTIQNAIATIGYGKSGLCKHLTSYGRESLSAMLNEKLISADVTLPQGVTPNYVANIVTVFVSTI